VTGIETELVNDGDPAIEVGVTVSSTKVSVAAAEVCPRRSV
jgi:hypothetical protein